VHQLSDVRAVCPFYEASDIALDKEPKDDRLTMWQGSTKGIRMRISLKSMPNRMPNIARFATQHDVIIFVSGRKSSNGKVLYNECKAVNPNSYHVENAEEINLDWFANAKTVGICGATSTPKWLMEECRDHILSNVK